MKQRNGLLRSAALLLIGALMLSVSACASPTMQTTFHVTDAETGLPVTNAIVRKSFRIGGAPDKLVKVAVDENGYCTIFGENIDPAGGGAGALADGYYYSSVSYAFKSRNAVFNRWEPWNPTLEIKMRLQKNPIEMMHYFHGGDWIRIPQADQPVGFDLEIFDWVSPFGKGKVSDFIFTAYRNEDAEGVSSGYTLSFSNPEDGIQEFVPEGAIAFSEFIFPYLAPESGYAQFMKKYKKNWSYAAVEHDYKDNGRVNYIFRVRSETDKDGKIISACYGRIKGELLMSGKLGLQFEYWFNPVPNERSLEWNGKNLLKRK